LGLENSLWEEEPRENFTWRTGRRAWTSLPPQEGTPFWSESRLWLCQTYPREHIVS